MIVNRLATTPVPCCASFVASLFCLHKSRILLILNKTMITEKDKNQLIENLRQMPIIESACRKTNISRTTFYRWKREDKEFAKSADEAMHEGENLISDLSENQLISLIRDGNFQAIQLWLKHHHKKYAEKLDITANVNIKEEPLTDEQKELVEKALLQAGILLNSNQQNHDTGTQQPAGRNKSGDIEKSS